MVQRRRSPQQIGSPHDRQVARGHAGLVGGEGDGVQVVHQVVEGGQVRGGHAGEQIGNLVLTFFDAEGDRTNEGPMERVCAQRFRKLPKEKLEEMLLEREDNDVLINNL